MRAVVAGEDGGVDGLAGAIGAALGGRRRRRRQRGGAAGDAAVGEVEAGLGEAEEGVILAGFGGDEPGASAPPRPRRRPGSKRTWPSASVVAVGEDVVVAREELDLDAGAGLGIGEAAQEDVQAVGAGQRGEAEVGDDEPLRRRGVPALARGRADDAGGQGVEAGREAGDDLAHRQGGGDVVVELLLELAGALPDRLAERVAQAGLLVAGQRVPKSPLPRTVATLRVPTR